jgi:hypothetical protein
LNDPDGSPADNNEVMNQGMNDSNGSQAGNEGIQGQRMNDAYGSLADNDKVVDQGMNDPDGSPADDDEVPGKGMHELSIPAGRVIVEGQNTDPVLFVRLCYYFQLRQAESDDKKVIVF